jgi:hypothetical protein
VIIICERKKQGKKVGIIIASNDPETCWVAIRYASFHLIEQKDVNIYFVESGLKYENMREGKYNAVRLVGHFTAAGGRVYMCDGREKLTNYLISHFGSLLNKKEIIGISEDDKIQSIVTENAYIREFKRVI